MEADMHNYICMCVYMYIGSMHGQVCVMSVHEYTYYRNTYKTLTHVHVYAHIINNAGL